MKDPLEELLLRQPLIEPPASLERRVHRRFRNRRAWRAWKRWRWPTAAAGILAAGILAAVYVLAPRGAGKSTSPETATSALQGAGPSDSGSATPAHPLRVEFDRSVLLDDGVVVLENKTAVRQLRRQTIRRVFWHDPERNIRIEATLPCEQVVLLREVTY
ncbi:MAG: hypothetical protein ABSG53_10050 [Thermoguttaceae bacterium]